MTSLPTKDENAGSDGPAYLRPAAHGAASLGVEPSRGLTMIEAAARRQRFGANRLPEPQPRPWPSHPGSARKIEHTEQPLVVAHRQKTWA